MILRRHQLSPDDTVTHRPSPGVIHRHLVAGCCVGQGGTLYILLEPRRSSVITGSDQSLVIMRCGIEGGRETSLETLLQLQVCHPERADCSVRRGPQYHMGSRNKVRWRPCRLVLFSPALFEHGLAAAFQPTRLSSQRLKVRCKFEAQRQTQVGWWFNAKCVRKA
ncbi:unnamed protein product [Pleuronectes platessa]|uniref:Uncharacterized protein n=1 Tax=Pleuronectes platessa TaxID=8262 RepID=A0A9N7Z4B3_PLEPL|nr:unnamed protein product [Pleuronectes platessa]